MESSGGETFCWGIHVIVRDGNINGGRFSCEGGDIGEGGKIRDKGTCASGGQNSPEMKTIWRWEGRWGRGGAERGRRVNWMDLFLFSDCNCIMCGLFARCLVWHNQ